MAIHLRQFDDHQRNAEREQEAREQAAEAMGAAGKAAARAAHLARTRERTQFMNSWIDDGYRNWRANQNTMAARVRFDLQYELALVAAKQTRDDISRHRHDAANKNGVEWFERNMKRLGVGGDADAVGGADAGPVRATSETALSYLQRVEELANRQSMTHEEAAEMMQSLREKATANRTARAERERRRRKMVVDQQRAQASATRAVCFVSW